MGQCQSKLASLKKKALNVFLPRAAAQLCALDESRPLSELETAAVAQFPHRSMSLNQRIRRTPRPQSMPRPSAPSVAAAISEKRAIIAGSPMWRITAAGPSRWTSPRISCTRGSSRYRCERWRGERAEGGDALRKRAHACAPFCRSESDCRIHKTVKLQSTELLFWGEKWWFKEAHR